MRLSLRWIPLTAVFHLLFSLATLSAESPLPVPVPDPLPGRFGIVEGTDVKSLIDSPQFLRNELSETTEAGEDRLITDTEIQTAYDLPMHALRALLLDPEDQKHYVPNLEVSEVLARYDGPVTYYRHHMETVFKFLFFSSSYNYVMNVYSENRPETEAFRMSFSLNNSLDGKFADVSGSWYLRELRLDGKPVTYIRYYNHSVFKDPQFGLKAALEHFSEGQLKKMLDSFYGEARKTCN